MEVRRLQVEGFEEVVRFEDASVQGFLVIHRRRGGVAYGGMRLMEYSSEKEALEDGLRLARAMTWKAAISSLPCGGGKIVIIQRPEMHRRDTFMRLAELVESYRGGFFTGRDVGVTLEDTAAMRTVTHYVADESEEQMGDLNEYTAKGVLAGMGVCRQKISKAENLKDCTVAIQGLGNVGFVLCRMLVKEGAKVVGADINERKLNEAQKKWGIERSSPEEIDTLAVEIFSPNAVGGLIHSARIPKMRCRSVAGAANVPLSDEEKDDWALNQRGILYAPDFIINAGALIRAVRFALLNEKDSSEAIQMSIRSTLMEVFEESERKNMPPGKVARNLAESRI